MNLFLDTHVLLWWLAGSDRLPRRLRQALDASRREEPLILSDISLWEIATLHGLGRIELDLPLREWLEKAVAGPRIRVEPITPAVASAVASLPSSFHRDPADRIILATAHVLGARLCTLDDRLRSSGLVSVF